jgi:hypothetical protein
MYLSILLGLYIFKYFFNDVKKEPFFNSNIMTSYITEEDMHGYDERYPLTSDINYTTLDAIDNYFHKLGILRKLQNPKIREIDKIAILDQLDMYNDFTMTTRSFVANNWFAGWLFDLDDN